MNYWIDFAPAKITVIDLHTHSTASDGTLAPAQLVVQAAAAGIKVLALTDHDCVAGVAEAQQAALESGIQLVSGVELSVTWSGRTLHLVGLNIDTAHPGLQQALADTRAYRHQRAEKIARRLARAGIADALAGARKFAGTGLISRTHFAHYLVEQGYAKDIQKVFRHFLVQGKPGFVQGEWMSLKAGIALLHAAGGLAVLAHPARYNLSRTRLRGLLQQLKELEIDGIEVVSGSHSQDENRSIAQHALDFDLPASQGSDYHGPEKPWVQLGKLPPLHYRCTPIWEAGLRLTGG